MLKQMIIKAGYLTSRMKPLPGPNYNESAIILKNFMAGVMGDIQTGSGPHSDVSSAYGAA